MPEGEAQGDGMAGEDEEHGRPWCSTPEKKNKRSNGQTVMNSIKAIHYGEENDEIFHVVVVVDAETRWFGRNSSSEVRRNLAVPNFGVRSAGL